MSSFYGTLEIHAGSGSPELAPVHARREESCGARGRRLSGLVFYALCPVLVARLTLLSLAVHGSVRSGDAVSRCTSDALESGGARHRGGRVTLLSRAALSDVIESRPIP